MPMFELCIRHDQLVGVTDLARMFLGVLFILDHFEKPPSEAGGVGTMEFAIAATRAASQCQLQSFRTHDGGRLGAADSG